jgi:hypothetical protein
MVFFAGIRVGDPSLFILYINTGHTEVEQPLWSNPQVEEIGEVIKLSPYV